MKRFFCVFAFLGLLAARPAQAQRLGYIDTEFIMTKMPEYAQAQTELNKLSDTWQKEIEAQQKDIDKMYRTYQAEEVVLTEPMKKKRQDEMLKKEQELKAYRTKQFGYEGQIFKKRQELNKPVQDKIFEAVEKVAKTKKLDLIFDKASELTMIYTNPTFDYTEYVLEELGLVAVGRGQPE
ncbi:MAG: OmpH family outer membrane protein, partial [Hymenobacter sp.]